MFHIVDVDNTLVFTNQLNTAGYVYALAQVGLEPRTAIPDRITRNVVRRWYPELTGQELGRITSHKQAYVRTHMEQTTLNLEIDHRRQRTLRVVDCRRSRTCAVIVELSQCNRLQGHSV